MLKLLLKTTQSHRLTPAHWAIRNITVQRAANKAVYMSMWSQEAKRRCLVDLSKPTRIVASLSFALTVYCITIRLFLPLLPYMM